MLKNKKISKIIIYITIIIIMISLLACIYSCEKKEPAVQPDPDEIMKKISGYFNEDEKTRKESVTYTSGEKSKKLSESDAAEIYSEDKNSPVDLSKIEKYSIIKANQDSPIEIGIFKLYDKTNAAYVKKMAQTRIAKMQKSQTGNIENNKNIENKEFEINVSEILNNAEVRSYGNYVYYVSHRQKDKIFEIIENSLKGV